jgi:hypothetical protein
MKSPPRGKRVALVLGLGLLAAICAALYQMAPRGLLRCYLVRWSHLETVAPNLFVDPDMSEPQRQILRSSLADAKARVAALYGEYTASPVIIAGHSMEVMSDYGGNSYNRAGKTYLTLAATFILLGPGGISSPDVLSHELAHAEFSARIGHGNRDEIPNWFDEGLAVQFDERYSEAEWRRRTDNGRTAPDLDQLGIIRHNDWLAYATAKHEVGRWLEAVGQKGFWAFLQAIRSGHEFQEIYSSIERAYSATR